MPIYLVETPEGQVMVRANNKSQAINHAIKKSVSAVTLTAEQVCSRMEDGEKVDVAGLSEDDLSGSQGFGDPKNSEV